MICLFNNGSLFFYERAIIFSWRDKNVFNSR
jgi:hypothetical protein